MAAAVMPGDSLFHLVFHNSPAMQSIVRAADGKLVQVNDTFVGTTGYTREQVIGKRPLDFNFWVEPGALEAFRSELEEKGRVIGHEVRLRSAGGRILTVLLSSLMVEIGGEICVLSAGVDITARKEAEQKRSESEARLSALYESLSAAVVVQDESGFIQANDAAVRMFGATHADQLIGLNPASTSPPSQPDGESSAAAAQRHLARACTGGLTRFEWVARKLDGTDFPVEVTLTPLLLDGRPVMQAVIHDLTDRKRAEADLRRALTQERELSQLRSEFVSLVSHEFRTPLEVIMSSVDNLQRYHDRLPPEKRTQLLSTINRSVRRMSGMMEEVLMLGRLETGGMTFTPVELNLPALCRRICDEIGSATGDRCPVHLEVAKVPQQARGDESLLRHVFANLLSNAIKYSAAGSAVEFTVQREGTDAVCHITDRGCGIPAPDQKRLFEAFHRGSNVRGIPGTGLGLLIVQRSVRLHHGTIRYESTEGQGTTFIIRLPLWN